MRLPQKPPEWRDLLKQPELLARLALCQDVSTIAQAAGNECLHWEDFRHKFSPPTGFELADVWRLVRMRRTAAAHVIPLVLGNQSFSFRMPDAVLRELHFVEQYAGSQLEVPGAATPSRSDRDRYLVNSLMQEAITSSQLEGAAVTLEQGKEMLRAGRAPRNASEQMILNNYQTMRHVQDLGREPLTVEMIHDLQRRITKNTLKRPDAAGRFRLPDEKIEVVDESDGTVLHAPPPAGDLPERVQRLCDFANDASERPFVHPVVRAILLHFWLAFEHPYVDGNGRTARALFYWYMIKSGYWLMEFASVSAALLKAPAQYRDAFLYVESDGGDATYFVFYHLKALRRALETLREYIQRKQAETAEMARLLRNQPGLNHRQLALLHHAVRHRATLYSFRSHATSHRVSLATARTDLLELERVGFLERRKRGREMVFLPATDLSEKVRSASGDSEQ